MTNRKASLVIHPVRFRILQALADGPKTTHKISSLLSDVPLSSLYRHLKILLDGEIIAIEDIRLVRGIQEKAYKIVQSPRLLANDLEGLTSEEHLRLFTTYIAILLQGYSDYLATTPDPDMEGDRVGYNEVIIWVTNEQLDEFGRKLNEALMPLINQIPGSDRHRHKLAIVTHPIANSRE